MTKLLKAISQQLSDFMRGKMVTDMSREGITYLRYECKMPIWKIWLITTPIIGWLYLSTIFGLPSPLGIQRLLGEREAEE